jgi:hypothetical protein
LLLLYYCFFATADLLLLLYCCLLLLYYCFTTAENGDVGVSRRSVYLLYRYKVANTDASMWVLARSTAAAQALSLLALLAQKCKY